MSLWKPVLYCYCEGYINLKYFELHHIVLGIKLTNIMAVIVCIIYRTTSIDFAISLWQNVYPLHVILPFGREQYEVLLFGSI